MTVGNRNWVRIGALSVVVAAVLAITGSLQMQRTAHADPESTIQAFIAAVNAGDATAAANTFAEDGYFVDLSPVEAFGIFGRSTIEFVFQDLGSENIQVTLVSSNTNGTIITGVVEFTDNTTVEAGVSRVLQPFEAEVVNDEIVSIVLTYDESDPETATYLAFLEAQPDDPDEELPPDGQQMPMNGTQPGMAFTGTFDGVLFIFVSIEPGPAGATQPAFIREGTCDAPGAVVSAFTPVLDGQAGALMNLTLADLEGRILVVEASESDATVVSCGAFADLAAIPLSPPVEALPDTGDGASTDDGTVIATLLLVLAGALALGGVTMVAAGLRRA